VIISGVLSGTADVMATNPRGPGIPRILFNGWRLWCILCVLNVGKKPIWRPWLIIYLTWGDVSAFSLNTNTDLYSRIKWFASQDDPTCQSLSNASKLKHSLDENVVDLWHHFLCVVRFGDASLTKYEIFPNTTIDLNVLYTT